MADVVEDARAAIRNAGGLVTPAEIAEAWHISPQAIHDRIQRGRFPEPIKEHGRARIYLRREVDQFMRRELLQRQLDEQRRLARAARLAIDMADPDEDVQSIQADLELADKAITDIERNM